MNKKTRIPMILLLLIGIVLTGFYYQNNKKSSVTTNSVKTETKTKATEKFTNDDFLLEGYPIDTVPLYTLKKLSSTKFFVNKDPSNFEDYFGKSVNYFNLVFETEASAEETLAYYRSLMDEQYTEYVPDDQVQGKIGAYKVSVSHYGNNPQNYAYLQVHLPPEQYQDKNPYFAEYPSVIELDTAWMEYESSYGLLNQKGGEIEYTQYFPLPKDESDQDEIINTYQEKYQNKQDYTFDTESGVMKWKDGEFTIVMTFSKDHGRIYLNMRKLM